MIARPCRPIRDGIQHRSIFLPTFRSWRNGQLYGVAWMLCRDVRSDVSTGKPDPGWYIRPASGSASIRHGHVNANGHSPISDRQNNGAGGFEGEVDLVWVGKVWGVGGGEGFFNWSSLILTPV